MSRIDDKNSTNKYLQIIENSCNILRNFSMRISNLIFDFFFSIDYRVRSSRTKRNCANIHRKVNAKLYQVSSPLFIYLFIYSFKFLFFCFQVFIFRYMPKFNKLNICIHAKIKHIGLFLND